MYGYALTWCLFLLRGCIWLEGPRVVRHEAQSHRVLGPPSSSQDRLGKVCFRGAAVSFTLARKACAHGVSLAVQVLGSVTGAVVCWRCLTPCLGGRREMLGQMPTRRPRRRHWDRHLRGSRAGTRPSHCCLDGSSIGGGDVGTRSHSVDPAAQKTAPFLRGSGCPLQSSPKMFDTEHLGPITRHFQGADPEEAGGGTVLPPRCCPCRPHLSTGFHGPVSSADGRTQSSVPGCHMCLLPECGAECLSHTSSWLAFCVLLPWKYGVLAEPSLAPWEERLGSWCGRLCGAVQTGGPNPPALVPLPGPLSPG